MPSGFYIVIAGKGFDPEAFLKSTPRPVLPWEAVTPSSSQPPRAGRLELYDIATGPFRLDLPTELDDFLGQFSDELRRALSAPGVDCRNLHIFDESSPTVTEFSFSNAQLKTVLGFGWDVTFATTGIDAKDWTPGSRILHR